ncbi:MAG: hypothetical protein IT453_03890, partial [Planctomycetes bacterium]|nr:hypothetical protein [Planctomycetota bacterium]
MVDKDRKRAAKHDVARVAAILRRWDPLGIEPGVAGPTDEYDGYAPSLVSLAARGATVEQLAARLGELRAAMLGVPADQGGDAAIAQQL